VGGGYYCQTMGWKSGTFSCFPWVFSKRSSEHSAKENDSMCTYIVLDASFHRHQLSWKLGGSRKVLETGTEFCVASPNVFLRQVGFFTSFSEYTESLKTFCQLWYTKDSAICPYNLSQSELEKQRGVVDGPVHPEERGSSISWMPSIMGTLFRDVKQWRTLFAS
jgi:hypothetical protein